MSKLPSWYDSWKTHDSASEGVEPDICPTCNECMEWESDVDVDEDTGRPYICGGFWRCENRNCGVIEEEEKQEDKNT